MVQSAFALRSTEAGLGSSPVPARLFYEHFRPRIGLYYIDFACRVRFLMSQDEVRSQVRLGYGLSGRFVRSSEVALTLHFNAQRCRSKTETIILEDLFSSVLLRFKKNITPLET